ncbi:hypothetical protein HK101_008745 [Irineochytrium annulatum]|nr:hypothetical protein HK101_008745 [Irineochytrium annulatum]
MRPQGDAVGSPSRLGRKIRRNILTEAEVKQVIATAKEREATLKAIKRARPSYATLPLPLELISAILLFACESYAQYASLTTTSCLIRSYLFQPHVKAALLVSLHGPGDVLLQTAPWLKTVPDYLDILRHILSLRKADGEYLVRVRCADYGCEIEGTSSQHSFRACYLLDLLHRMPGDDPAVYATRVTAIGMLLDRGARIDEHTWDEWSDEGFFNAMLERNTAESFQPSLMRVALNGDRLRHQLSFQRRTELLAWLAASRRPANIELLAEVADRGNGGWDANVSVAFKRAIEVDNGPAVRVLCDKANPQGALMTHRLTLAIESRAPESIRALLDGGAAPTAACVTAAIGTGEMELAAELVGPRWKVAPDGSCLVALLDRHRCAGMSEAAKVGEIRAVLAAAVRWGGGGVGHGIVGEDVMRAAVDGASKAVMRVLIQHGGVVDSRILSHGSLAARGVGFVKLLLEARPDLGLSTDVIPGLPRRGYDRVAAVADPMANAKDWLEMAAGKGDFRMVLFLLRKGVRVSWEVLLVPGVLENLAMTEILIYHGAVTDGISRDAGTAGRMITHLVAQLDNCCNIDSRLDTLAFGALRAEARAIRMGHADKGFTVGLRVARAISKTLWELSVATDNTVDFSPRLDGILAALTDSSPSVCKHRVVAVVWTMMKVLPPEGKLRSAFTNLQVECSTKELRC